MSGAFRFLLNVVRGNYLVSHTEKGGIFMCKYCKLETFNETIGEKGNWSPIIGRLRDGSRLIEISLDRYSVEKEGIYRNELLIENCVVSVTKNQESLSEKHIKIKYCPFCGEKL